MSNSASKKENIGGNSMLEKQQKKGNDDTGTKPERRVRRRTPSRSKKLKDYLE